MGAGGVAGCWAKGTSLPPSRGPMSKSWDVTDRKEVRRVNPRSSHHKEQMFPFTLLPVLFVVSVVSEKMDVSRTSCGNHFTIHANQIIMLFA